MRNSILITSSIYISFLFVHSPLMAQPPAGKMDPHISGFIENAGQITDQHGAPNSAVQFMYHRDLFNLQLKRDGFSYETFAIHENSSNLSEAGAILSDDDVQPEKSVSAHRVDVKFKHANRDVVLQSAHALPAYLNFIHAPVATNRQLQVEAYSQITYHNLYKGIDLVFECHETAPYISYHFIVHPGADYSQIVFSYAGATDLFLNDSGAMVLHTPFGYVNETAPRYIVDGKEIGNASFQLSKNERRFSACKYDRSQTLVIDPDMLWGTYYGGEKGDEIAEVAIGSDLHPVIDGQTVSIANIATAGAYQETFNGGINDLFIARFNPDGTMDWATYFGGNDKDYCYALAVDQNNDIIAAGNSESQGLATPGAYQDSVDGVQSDVLIAKFSPDGNLMWSTYFGGEASEEVRNVVTDDQGNLYLAGTTSSLTNIASPNAFQDTMLGFDDALLMKFTADGNRVWSTYYGDSGVDRNHAVCLDRFGHVIMAGTTSSTKNIATPGVHQTVYGGGSADAMVVKWDTSGTPIWGTYFGGLINDRARGIEADSAGNLYLGGFTNSSNGIATPGSHQDTWYPGSQGGEPTEDAYLTRFTPDGQQVWGTYLGGAHVENLWGMTMDHSQQVIYIVGSSNSIENIAFGNAIQPIKSGGEDAIFARFLLDGTLEWSTYFGGLISDQFEDVAVDSNHFVYTATRATGIDMPTTPHVYTNNYGGGASDAMLYKFYGGDDCFDPFEPNEDLITAHPVFTWQNNFADTTIYGYNAAISSASDQDWYTFSIADSEPNLMAIISNYAVDLNLNLYNASGILIYQSWGVGTTPDTISVNGLSTGDYFLEVPHAPGNYDSLGCYRLQLFVSDAPFAQIGIPTFVTGNITQQNLLLYPNPASSDISFFLPCRNPFNAEVVIRDAMGRTMYSSMIPVSGSGQRLSVNTRDFPAGAYAISIFNGSQIMNGKFIKE